MASEITVSLPDVSLRRLLHDWQWLLKTPHAILLVTAMGDAFVANEADAVFFLDTLEGALLPVASSREAFFSLMNGGHYDPAWFIPDMVDIKAASEPLAVGQCYSYRVPPCLGGSLEPSNVGAVEAVVHFSIAGQLHRQLKDLPPGTRISGFNVIDDLPSSVEAPEANASPSKCAEAPKSLWHRLTRLFRSKP